MSRNRRLWTVLAGIGIVAAGAVTAPARAADFAPPPTYRAGDYEAAERAFRRAVLAHPRSAAAHNNLAQTLADLDRHDEALAEARVAVGLGGPQEDTSIRTLDAIVSRTGRGEQEWHR